MKNLFGYNGVLFRASEFVTAFVVSNILTLLCCIPVVTIGAALAAHQKVMQNIVMGESRSVFKSYFTALWENLGKATGLLLLFLLTAAFLLADFYCVYAFAYGIFSLVLYIVLFVVSILVLGVTACCMSLIVRYENTLLEHLRNTLYLLLSHFFRIVVMALVAAVPFVIFFVYPSLFVKLIPVWVFFGISLFAYMQARLVKPILESMDTMHETQIMEDHTLT